MCCYVYKQEIVNSNINTHDLSTQPLNTTSPRSPTSSYYVLLFTLHKHNILSLDR